MIHHIEWIKDIVGGWDEPRKRLGQASIHDTEYRELFFSREMEKVWTDILIIRLKKIRDTPDSLLKDIM